MTDPIVELPELTPEQEAEIARRVQHQQAVAWQAKWDAERAIERAHEEEMIRRVFVRLQSCPACGGSYGDADAPGIDRHHEFPEEYQVCRNCQRCGCRTSVDLWPH